MRIVSMSSEVQLSDCVIALRPRRGHGGRLVSTIRENWMSLLSIYSGTGAKYTTVERVERWLLDYDL
jgi:hypothetical protein